MSNTQGEITHSFGAFLFSLALIINVCFTISNIAHLFVSSTTKLTHKNIYLLIEMEFFKNTDDLNLNFTHLAISVLNIH